MLSRVALTLVSMQRAQRDGNDTESADDQTGSPLHVLSDVAHQEGQLEGKPEAAVNGAAPTALSRMQTRHSGSAAAAATAGMGESLQHKKPF